MNRERKQIDLLSLVKLLTDPVELAPLMDTDAAHARNRHGGTGATHGHDDDLAPHRLGAGAAHGLGPAGGPDAAGTAHVHASVMLTDLVLVMDAVLVLLTDTPLLMLTNPLLQLTAPLVLVLSRTWCCCYCTRTRRWC
ncbi:hypothetical protein PC128_g11966 [Phytophthora cactorum]|nr:hypothetical protein PC120_g9247 [Phytophthora cactorum]KAG3066251.1 hypothetical protein PC121_g10927 [Phytophthora cactorum]KAG3188932.1 hypothetical protein PC128_g11966 [Phytophthora cactorum]KAG4055578.1 hypothetical protein PC123_g9321 [Phytophthora cactorum]